MVKLFKKIFSLFRKREETLEIPLRLDVDLMSRWLRLHTPGTKEFHARWCSKTMGPCRCEFDNDEDYFKYGDAFEEMTRVE